MKVYYYFQPTNCIVEWYPNNKEDLERAFKLMEEEPEKYKFVKLESGFYFCDDLSESEKS